MPRSDHGHLTIRHRSSLRDCALWPTSKSSNSESSSLGSNLCLSTYFRSIYCHSRPVLYEGIVKQRLCPMTRRAVSYLLVILTIKMFVLALGGSSSPGITTAETTIAVRAGDALQAAVDRAKYGDTVVLEAGATFVGPLYLRNKGASQGSNGAFVTIRTSDLTGIAGEGQRVTPQQARSMPKIVSPDQQAAIVTEPEAHHFKFIGV